MKISVNALTYINEHYGSAGNPAPNGVDELVQKIGAQLGAVEEVISLGDRYAQALVAKVVSCEKHPNADRLNVCRIDDGGTAQNVERDSNNHVQVVCGAPNVRAGLTVVWLPPGATVPSTYNKEPFVLDMRDIRGTKSNGMLASPRELALSDNHDGIMELAEDIAPGTPFGELTRLNGDHIIDMENKMFTHRPDCFGWLGVAREIEGIYRRPYKSPEWYRTDPAFPEPAGEALPLEVRNELPQLVPRFVAVTMKDVQITTSPLWLQADLARVGLRPINNIVDYTNFYMLLTGQPLHAYDYDKVRALSGGDKAVLAVRHPQEGEKLQLLNGKEITPRAEAIMIATDKQLIGVGGVMGGADTEVDEHTKNIIIEVANFDMYSIRRTSMEHGLFTDAVARFNKGQSPLQNKAVAAKIVDQVTKNGHGVIAGPVIDDNHVPAEVLQRSAVHPPVAVTRQFINERLGLQLSSADMAQLLTNVEFKAEVQGDSLTITAPFWRTDIEISEDVVEEVGRLYGYDHLPLDLPRRDLTPAPRNALLELKARVRTVLSGAGANELLTYTFVHGNLLDKAGQSRDMAFQLANALSPDLQYYRLSLTPSLLEKVHSNIKADYVRSDDNEFAVFELNKVHAKSETDEDGLPREFERLALVFAADTKTAARKYAGAPYYQARTYLQHLYERLGQSLPQLVPLAGADIGDHPLLQHMLAPYEPQRAALVYDGQRFVGVVGEYKGVVRRTLKLPDYAAGFELFVSALEGSATAYKPLGKFPKITADMSFRVKGMTKYQELYDAIWLSLQEAQAEHGYVPVLKHVDIYQAKDDTEHKNITFRLWLYHPSRTLTKDEVNNMLVKVAQSSHVTIYGTLV